MAANESSQPVEKREKPYRIRIEDDANTPVSVAVVKGLAAVKRIRPDEIDARLYDFVDGDALDDLLRHASRNDDVEWKVQFAIEDCDVTISSNGLVTVN